MRLGSICILLVLMAALVSGCSSPPDEDVSAAAEAGAGEASVAPTQVAVAPADPNVHVHPSNARTVPQELHWEAIEPMPLPRAEHTVVNIGSRFHVVGGFLIPSVNDAPLVIPAGGGPIPSDRHDVYDAETNTWTSAPPYPTTLDHAPGVEFNEEVYIFRGPDNSYKFNPGSGEWIPFPGPPNGHSAGVAAVIDHAIYVTGGPSTKVDVYDPFTKTWKTLEGEGLEMPTRRGHTSGEEVHGKLYVAGGDTAGHSENTEKNEVFDPARGNWTDAAPLPVVRGSTASVTWMDRLIIMGGQSGEDGQEAYRDVDAYDPFTDTWAKLPDMPHGRHGFGAGVWKDEIYVFGGAPKQGIYGFADSAVLRVG